MKRQQEIQKFVLKHYQAGKLDTQHALRTVKERLHTSHATLHTSRSTIHTPRRYAAIFTLSIIMVGAYAVYTNIRHDANTTPHTPHSTLHTPQPQAFHFDDTPINEVLSELNKAYGTNLQTNDTTKHLTGDFEAESPELLVSIIEQTLGIKIEGNVMKKE